MSLQKNLDSPQGQMQIDVGCSIEWGSFICLFGKSGAGKTSLLRMLAGLMKPDSGIINNGPEEWYNSESNINLPVQKRKVGFVFQDYALFPHMTVRQNLEYALPKDQDADIIERLLEVSELKGLDNKKPLTLSGGQKQRLALIRSFLPKPKLLLMDEPLAALDPLTRKKMRDLIKYFHQEYKPAILMVSHDPSEMVYLSEKVIHLEEGKIVKSGKPKEVLSEFLKLGF